MSSPPVCIWYHKKTGCQLFGISCCLCRSLGRLPEGVDKKPFVRSAYGIRMSASWEAWQIGSRLGASPKARLSRAARADRPYRGVTPLAWPEGLIRILFELSLILFIIRAQWALKRRAFHLFSLRKSRQRKKEDGFKKPKKDRG
jgi:hypothetical protein